ncbi:MAG TPA: efflux RND transporter permease subunit [Bryobacteraceae bacterium]|jgi:multidrug efflux pump subunit AcrB|nr:efflux RND transporter permease subunit [Bryobacteraceae bacterium]
MWIVRIALNRPYTFVVLTLLILLISPLVIQRTPVDIFPNVNIPVVVVLWNYTGLSAEEMEERVSTVFERNLTTTVNDMEHTESQTYNGKSIIKIFFHPNVKIEMAVAQIAAQGASAVRFMPPGTTPPFILVYNASSVPIVQLALSGKGLSEQQLFDFAINSIRVSLATVQGASIPYPYGGKQRQIMIDIRPDLLQSKGLSPADVVNAVTVQNLILPSGTSKIGPFEYDVDLNSSPTRVAEINNLPIKAVNNTTIYIHDVANVRDGFSPQTNIVLRDGARGCLMTIMKVGQTSTLEIVKQVREALPAIAATLPKELKIEPIADQSIFVRAAVSGVVREAIIAACLTATMILLFLGSWRSTIIIAVSIPLSILISICVMSALGETINIMTLGGLALAVGILVDDATVEIENIHRNLVTIPEVVPAILEGARQIAVPALVSTLCICIVFLPMFLLTGVARYLFIPLAEAVVFAMLASYLLSRTLVPTMAMYLFKPHVHEEHAPAAWNIFAHLQLAFERMLERTRNSFRGLLESCIARRAVFIPLFLIACALTFLLVPWLGQDFFPSTDAGRFNLHMRTKTATRIEESARTSADVEAAIRRIVPADEIASLINNIGLPYSSINMSYSTSAPIGTMDTDILVTLTEDHHPTDNYVKELRDRLPREFPGVLFYFTPADIVTQILNFGLPAPIDIQIASQDSEASRIFATDLLAKLKSVPGTADLRVHQPFDQPKIHITVDRTKAVESGFSQLDVANSALVSLSGSSQTTPEFWLDPRNGVSYSVVTQTPQFAVASLSDLRNIPIAGSSLSASGAAAKPEILGDVATMSRGSGLAVVSHYNIRRVVDIFGAVQDRDLGAVGREITKIVDANRKNLPRGMTVLVRGQYETMQGSFTGLLGGLALAIVLVYALIVVNFQSWLDPFIIITALPAALAGIVLFLFATRTTISVPALMGSIMSVGVATSNSILVVSFARERLEAGEPPDLAALDAGFVRFRPVLMTALAMIIGMVPMALGLGEGGEQNAPLGRAVIGGLIFATAATLFFVPTVFSVMHRQK